MRRFGRYVLYREAYRFLREAASESGGDKPADQLGSTPDREPVPIEATDTLDGETALQLLQGMDPYDFEYFVADLWERLGWQTEVSDAAVDQGVDVVARKAEPFEQTTLIQAKRYGPGSTVGSPDVQQYASLEDQYDGVDQVAIVTTGTFSRQARDLADRLNVKLVNGEELIRLVAEHGGLELVAAYTELKLESPDEPEASTAAPEAETTQRDDASPASLDDYPYWGVVAGTALWVVMFLTAGVLPEALGGALILAAWVGLPLSLYLDGDQVRSVTGGWPSTLWLYVAGGLVPLFGAIAGGVYLYRRRDHVPTHEEPRAESEPPASAEATTADEPSADPDPTKPADGKPTAETRRIVHNGETYACFAEYGPNGEWLLAYGSPVEGSPEDGDRLFVYEGQELAFTTERERLTDADIAGTGRAVVVDGLEPEAHTGRLLVVEPDGERQFTHLFNARLGPCAITNDGHRVAVSAFAPDDRTHVFDPEIGEEVLAHDHEHGTMEWLTLEGTDDDWELVLGDGPERRQYAVDPAGSITWTSETFDRAEAVERGQDSDEVATLEEALAEAQSLYEAAETEAERRRRAEELADTHLELARALERGEDRHREHCQLAREHYYELLPWHAGREGAARALALEVAHHEARGETAMAEEARDRIAELEADTDVSLLEDADREELGLS